MESSVTLAVAKNSDEEDEDESRGGFGRVLATLAVASSPNGRAALALESSVMLVRVKKVLVLLVSAARTFCGGSDMRHVSQSPSDVSPCRNLYAR